MTMPATVKYAVYPGSVTIYNGTVVSFTALELATAYGVESESYITVNNNTEIPSNYFEYIHLKPRADNRYVNIKVTAQDDDQTLTWDRDFDGSKTYTQETDPNNIDKDIDMPHN